MNLPDARKTEASWGVTLASALIALYLRFVYRTCRWTIQNEADVEHVTTSGKPFIIAFWHARMCAMPHVFRAVTARTHVLISAHRDGEVIAQAIERLGFSTIRGSTAKRKPGGEKAVDKGGAAALRAMLHRLKAGEIVAITPDGPRGPRMRASTGTATLAALSGAPLLCASFSAKTALSFNSWDRFLLPLPFGHIHVRVAEPATAPRAGRDPDLAQMRHAIEETLNQLTRACDETVGRTPVEPAPATPMPNATQHLTSIP